MKTRPVGWSERDAYRPKLDRMATFADVLVWVQGRDGKVFSATQARVFLAPDEICTGQHSGLVWWPFAYI